MNIAELAKKLTFTHGKITFTGEDAMQACLQEWMRVKSHEYPELAFFYHVPNLNKAGRWEGIKRMLLGVKAGVWDWSYDEPRGNYAGFRMELKVGKNKLSPEQKAWREFYEKAGFYTVVVYDEWYKAAQECVKYLRLPKETV